MIFEPDNKSCDLFERPAAPPPQTSGMMFNDGMPNSTAKKRTLRNA